MPGFDTAAIQDLANGSRARVAFDGAMLAGPAHGQAESAGVVLGTTWELLLSANEFRRGVQIQNQSSTVGVFIVLSGQPVGTPPAYRIDPGATYQFPTGLTYRGEVWAKCSSSAEVVALEFGEPDADVY